MIPIVILAMMVQLIAPIAAFRVVAYATTDPLYMSSICEHVTPSADEQSAPAEQARHAVAVRSVGTALAAHCHWFLRRLFL